MCVKTRSQYWVSFSITLHLNFWYRASHWTCLGYVSSPVSQGSVCLYTVSSTLKEVGWYRGQGWVGGGYRCTPLWTWSLLFGICEQPSECQWPVCLYTGSSVCSSVGVGRWGGGGRVGGVTMHATSFSFPHGCWGSEWTPLLKLARQALDRQSHILGHYIVFVYCPTLAHRI